MARKLVRRIASSLILFMACCAVVQAQTSYTYTIREGSGVSTYNYPDLNTFHSRQNYFYAAPNLVNIVLANDDNTLRDHNNGFWIEDGFVTVKSDQDGAKRTIGATNSPIFIVRGYPSTYYQTSDLTLTKDIKISGVNNTDGGYYFYDTSNYYFSFQGGALINNGGDLHVDGVTFDSNSTTVTNNNYYGFGVGAAITSPNYYAYLPMVTNAAQATFTNNKADGGGAVALFGGEFYADEAKFSGNSAGLLGGGAMFLQTDSYASVQKGTFEGNTAENTSGASGILIGDGGAISAFNADLDLKGSTFVDNKAAGLGGAIFFSALDETTRHLTLGAFEGANVTISGNLDSLGNDLSGTGTSNSIVFSGSDLLDSLSWGEPSSMGRILLNVDVESMTRFDMRDPMKIDDRAPTPVASPYPGYPYSLFDNAQNIEVTIEKTGVGVWRLDGDNALDIATGGVKVDVLAGTLTLADGARLALGKDSTGIANNRLSLAAGTTLNIGESGSVTANEIVTSNFGAATGSQMNLKNDLNLTIVNSSSTPDAFAGKITGSGNLTKLGDGKWTFAGSSATYSGDVSIDAGTLDIGTGGTLSTTGSVTFAQGAVLTVVGNKTAPNIKANSITLNDTRVRIEGVSGGAGDRYVILQSDNAIVGNPLSDATMDQTLDYMNVNFAFSDDLRQYYANVDLTWYSNTVDGSGKLNRATGTFTIDPATGPAYFKVDTVLESRYLNPDNVVSGWNGNDLTKKGSGTLELSAANTYTGLTTVKEGTLLLTHSQGTGTGTSAIMVEGGAKLALDFKDAATGNSYTYGRQITGGGSVLKQGDSTIQLTGDNSYENGTFLEQGILAFSKKSNLGSGPVVFEGGTLRNTAEISDFNLAIRSEDGKDIQLDTRANLTVLSAMSGEGGLVKTGAGVLTLTGTGGYLGKTHIREGVLATGNMDSIGKNSIVISDGATFRNTNALSNDRNVVLEKRTSGTIVGNIIETQADMTLSGVVSGGGMLVKKGRNHTLSLSGANTYSGGTRIDEGTVSISSETNLGSGAVMFNGGTLQNTRKIDELANSISMVGTQSARFETLADLSLSGTIGGGGDLIKTGDAVLTLSGKNTYIGKTFVKDGTLAVDGSLQSRVYVERDAALTGSGRIDNDVYFEKGSVYEWTCVPRAVDSTYLNVSGNVYFDEAVFRPITAGALSEYAESVDGRTVLRYLGSLEGDRRFAYIDDSASAYFDFELDYSTPGEIRVVTTMRDTGRGLSDSVAMGIMMSQRRAHRRPFDRIDASLREGRYLGLKPVVFGAARGQDAAAGKNIWGSIYGRTTEYESTYFKNSPWRFNSFGFQAGYSFARTNWLEWGVTGGLELPELENYSDRITASDGYLGLYYGRRIQGMWELKGYLGAGSQRYESRRRDSLYTYKTRYYGDSFQANVELARPFKWRQLVLRPFVGFDLEYASQQSSKENRVSTEYRTYSKASLTQLFVRVGLDAEKRYQRGDLRVGVAYSNMIGGDSLPAVKVYYPVAERGATVYGSNLGQNIFTIRGGGDVYLDAAKSQTLFLDLTSDIYADRAGGQCEFTLSGGYSYRF